MTKSVAGLFPRHEDADRAVRALADEGIPHDDISVLGVDPRGVEQETKEVGADEVVRAGASAGLVGIAGVTAFALPGIGPMLAAGPLAAAFGLTGGEPTEEEQEKARLEGALVRAGLMEAQAQAYADGVRQGHTLVAVEVDDEQSGRVADIFTDSEGFKIEVRRRDATP